MWDTEVLLAPPVVMVMVEVADPWSPNRNLTLIVEERRERVYPEL
jgi:hypothetical protein